MKHDFTDRQTDRQTDERKWPEISVIVPVYNVAPYLAACLDSILAQTFRDFEVILVEDGSTDGSREMAEQYAARDARVRLLCRRWNRGAAAARNLGLEEACGTYVAFVDADDIASPDFLAVLHRAAEQGQADIVQAGYQMFSEQLGDGRTFVWTQEAEFLSTEILARLDWFVPRARLHIAPWCKLFRKAYLDAHRMMFYDMPVAEDVCFHYQGLLSAARYVVLTDILYHYRVHRDSIMDVKGEQRAERYAVAIARSLEKFSDWMQQEPLFSDAGNQRELRYGLCAFLLSELHRTMQSQASFQAAYERCQTALAREPHDKMFDALLYRALRD